MGLKISKKVLRSMMTTISGVKKELYNICKKSQGKTLYFPKLKLHHGHSTVKTSVWRSFKFNESLKFKRGQDCKIGHFGIVTS